MGFLKRHAVAFASLVVVVLGAAALIGYALSSRGYPARHVELNDGGVWVTSDKDGLFGRLNKPAGSLDLAVNPPGGAQAGGYQLDVRQDGAAVVAWDQAQGRLLPADIATGTLQSDDAVAVSAGEQVAMGGGTLAVLDPATEKVWVQPVDTTSGVDGLSAVDSSAKPAVALRTAKATGGASGSAAVTVGSDGTVYAADRTGRLARISPDGRGGYLAPVVSTLPGVTAAAPLQSIQLAAVGSSLVALDAEAGRLLLPDGHSVDVDHTAADQLQASSDAGPAVVVATPGSLVSVDLASGALSTLYSGAGGKPAKPTWLGDCVHAAWAGAPGLYVRSCDGRPATRGNLDLAQLDDPVFRVNRGFILLNDLVTGSVVDLSSLREVDNWSQVKPPPIAADSQKNKNNNGNTSTVDRPPKAADDLLGARLGRTTVLHVLDNDSDPQGYILSVSAVSRPDDPQASVVIAPDGQTVQITMPDRATEDVHFTYTVDDGKGLSDSARVTVEPRPESVDKPPNLRPGYQARTYPVASGGELDLPVLDDWRDYDGDPVVLTGARATAGTVSTTPDGRVDYIAPTAGGAQKITYQVSDGHGGTDAATIGVTVLAPNSSQLAAPTANPDVARGQVGQPITITPLANDLPGADPTSQQPTLALVSDIPSPAGTQVQTDRGAGTVTVTASRAGVFLLTYTESYGNAPLAKGQIRVDVDPASATPQSPIAVPDQATLFGQTAQTVDVLANDFDPSGYLLDVQHAQATGATGSSQLELAIVQGRFLRIRALTATLSPNPTVVQYTVTDGVSQPATGEVTVTQLPAPADDTPVAHDDTATVRAGDSTSVPVLDNDTDPDGAALSLVADVDGAPAPGRLSVSSEDGTVTGNLGDAYVSGNLVRYVGPSGITAPLHVEIDYVAQNPDGQQATGHVHVTVNPPPSAADPDAPPTPADLTARVVAGDTTQIIVPTTGVDPDGDSVTVTGITVPPGGTGPTRGRISAITANTLTYESFPTAAGTDTLGYVVEDDYGRTAVGTLRVAVVPPGDPQPPVAVDDQVTAAPGSTLRVDVLSNDLVADGDTATIAPLRQTDPELPAGVTLVSPQGPIALTVPPATGRPLVVLYAVGDGTGQPSVGTLTVNAQNRWVSPPIAADASATPAPRATSARVDVLSRATDPAGLRLTTTRVFDPQASVGADGQVTVPVTGSPQTIPYEIRNAAGGTATGVIRVPASGSGAPYAKPGQLIQLGRDASRTVDIDDYVIDPAGKQVRLTTADQLFAAPAGLAVASSGDHQLKLTSSAGYTGPAAITVQVTDGTSLTDPNGQSAYISVPVQVGPVTPVLHCSTDPIALVEGGASVTVDPTSLCHTWLPDSSALASLAYTATWARQPTGTTVTGAPGHTLTLTAGGAARPGETGTLTVGVQNSPARTQTLNVRILPLGPPTMRAVTIDGFKATDTATVNLTGYVSSPLRDPVIGVVRITQTSGMPSTATASGASISITPGRDSHGAMTYSVVATDVPDHTRTDRQVVGTVSLQVLNVPDAPPTPSPDRTVQSQTAQLSWSTPAANGAPIDSYRLSWNGGSTTCAASPCTVHGLHNGSIYTFSVQAHNAVGYSAPSGRSAPVQPNAVPGSVTALRVGNPQDGQVTLTWGPAPVNGTPVLTYLVSWGGGSRTVPGTSTTATPTGLVNDDHYTFTVTPRNQLGPGPSVSTSGQSSGRPSSPTGVQVGYASDTGSNSRTVRISWNAVDPNGIGPVTYTVSRSGRVICPNTSGTTCLDQNLADGSSYTWTVTAANATAATDPSRHTSPPASSPPFSVASTPDPMPAPTLSRSTTDGDLNLSYTVPKSNGKDSIVKCTLSSGGGCPGVAGSSSPAGGVHTVTLTGLPAGQSVSVTMQTCNSDNTGNQANCDATVTSGSQKVEGPPNAPTGLTCSLSGTTITWTWNQPATVANSPVSRYRIGGDGSGTQGGTSYARSYPKDGASHQITVQSIDSRGEAGGTAGPSGCTDAQPPPPPPPQKSLIVGWGPSAKGQPNCSSSDCHFIGATVKGFSANTTYTVQFTAGGAHPISGTFSLTTDSSGAASAAQNYGAKYYGYPGVQFDLTIDTFSSDSNWP